MTHELEAANMVKMKLIFSPLWWWKKEERSPLWTGRDTEDEVMVRSLLNSQWVVCADKQNKTNSSRKELSVHQLSRLIH